jgi:hypothetical protein
VLLPNIIDRDPFIVPASDQQRAQCNKMKLKLSGGIPSDQITVMNAADEFSLISKKGGVPYRFCEEHFLSYSTMNFLSELNKQLGRCLESVLGMNMDRDTFARRNEHKSARGAAIRCAVVSIALCSSVAVRRSGSSTFATEKGCKTKVHPSSVNKKQGQSSSSSSNQSTQGALEIIAFQELVATPPSHPGAASLFMISTSPVSTFGYLIACGGIVVEERGSQAREEGEAPESDDEKDVTRLEQSSFINILVDGWLRLRMPKLSYDVITFIRLKISEIITTYLEAPRRPLPPSYVAFLDSVTEVIAREQFSGVSSIVGQRNVNPVAPSLDRSRSHGTQFHPSHQSPVAAQFNPPTNHSVVDHGGRRGGFEGRGRGQHNRQSGSRGTGGGGRR